MSTLTQVIEAKWFTQFKNGNDFLAAPADFSFNLVGSIFEKVKLVATIKTYTTVELDNYYLTADSLTLSQGNFNGDVSVGDICRIIFSGDPTIDYRVAITSVSNTVIYYNLINNGPPPQTIPQTISGTDLLVVESDLTYLRYNWGLKSRLNSSDFYRSYLDDQTLSFITTDIGARTPTPADPRGTAFEDGLKLSINGHSGDFKARYVQNSQIPIDGFGAWNSAQEYEIEHVFKIQDYSEADIQNYINTIRPSNYLGESTLDYNSQFEFRTIETNPSTSKIDNYTSTGAVGFFGELLNGGPSVYSISNLVLTRVASGAPIESLAASEETKVTLTVNSTESSFNSDPAIVINHFAMVTDYVQKDIEFDTLFRNDLLRVEGVSTENGLYITEGKILSYTVNSIDIEFTVNPNEGDLDGLNYELSVLVGNPDLTNAFPNKVQLPIQAAQYSDAFDIEGLIGPGSLGLYTRDCNPETDTAFSSFEIISGELINTKFQFLLSSGTITNIQIQTITSKLDLNQVVDTQTIDISGFEIVNGVQRIDQVLPNPYSLGNDGSIIWFSGNIYRVIYPYRLPFDKLIPVAGLADDLFDTSEPNNGQNQSVFYQQSKGYTVHIAYLVTMLKDGRETDYLFKSPTLLVNDFESTL